MWSSSMFLPDRVRWMPWSARSLVDFSHPGRRLLLPAYESYCSRRFSFSNLLLRQRKGISPTRHLAGNLRNLEDLHGVQLLQRQWSY